MTRAEFGRLTLTDFSALHDAIQADDSRIDLERGQLRADLFNVNRGKDSRAFTAEDCRLYEPPDSEREDADEAFVKARLAMIQGSKNSDLVESADATPTNVVSDE